MVLHRVGGEGQRGRNEKSQPSEVHKTNSTKNPGDDACQRPAVTGEIRNA
jgi:hypothetical protein